MKLLMQPDDGQSNSECRLGKNRQRGHTDWAFTNDNEPNGVADGRADKSHRQEQNPTLGRQLARGLNSFSAIDEQVYYGTHDERNGQHLHDARAPDNWFAHYGIGRFAEEGRDKNHAGPDSGPLEIRAPNAM